MNGLASRAEAQPIFTGEDKAQRECVCVRSSQQAAAAAAASKRAANRRRRGRATEAS